MKQYNFPKGAHPRPEGLTTYANPALAAKEEQLNRRIDAHRDGEFPELENDAAYVALSNELRGGN